MTEVRNNSAFECGADSCLVAVAEIVHYYFPKHVELHNYPQANGASQKMYNWKTLRRKFGLSVYVAANASRKGFQEITL